MGPGSEGGGRFAPGAHPPSVTQYLIDTTALIDVSKGHEWVAEGLLRLVDQGDQLAVCAVSVSEFYSGIRHGTDQRVDKMIAAMEYWDISIAAAVAAGEIRYGAARKGRTLSATDCLIAALALERGATVLSDDNRAYSQIDVPVLTLRPATR